MKQLFISLSLVVGLMIGSIGVAQAEYGDGTYRDGTPVRDRIGWDGTQVDFKKAGFATAGAAVGAAVGGPAGGIVGAPIGTLLYNLFFSAPAEVSQEDTVASAGGAAIGYAIDAGAGGTIIGAPLGTILLDGFYRR